jgi:hypothetical protein
MASQFSYRQAAGILLWQNLTTSRNALFYGACGATRIPRLLSISLNGVSDTIKGTV